VFNKDQVAQNNWK